jgi:hypothetical protein
MEVPGVCSTDRWPAVTIDEVQRASQFHAIPDKFLDATHLAAARSVLERVVGLDNTRLAFVSGSLAAGLGHGLSDVDLYVATRSGGDPKAYGYRQDGYIVQINPVSGDCLDLMARTCSAYTALPGDRWQVELGEDELQRSVRYVIGTVLADNGSGLPAPAQGRQTMRRVLMTLHAYELASLAEDALGALQVGDELTALQASLMGLEHALEAALAGTGDVYVGRKFGLRRLARSAALRTVLPELMSELGRPAVPGGPGETAGLVTQRMLLASHLVGSVLLDGWDRPAPEIRAFPDRWTAGGPTRSPWVVPVRLADSWGMAGPDIGYRTKQGMVRLWLELDGRPADDIHRGLDADPDLAGTSRDLLEAAIAQLIEKAVAVPSSDGRR